MFQIVPQISINTLNQVLSIIPVEPKFVSVHIYGAPIIENNLLLNAPQMQFEDSCNRETRILNPTKESIRKIYDTSQTLKYSVPRVDFKEATFYYNDATFTLNAYRIEVSFSNNGKKINHEILEICEKLFNTKIEVKVEKGLEYEPAFLFGTVTTNSEQE